MGRPPKANLPPDLTELLRQIGRNVSALRTRKRFSQTELSRRSKVSLTTINEIETRQFRDIRLSTLSAIARTLGVPVVRVLERPKQDSVLPQAAPSATAAPVPLFESDRED